MKNIIHLSNQMHELRGFICVSLGIFQCGNQVIADPTNLYFQSITLHIYRYVYFVRLYPKRLNRFYQLRPLIANIPDLFAHWEPLKVGTMPAACLDYFCQPFSCYAWINPFSGKLRSKH